jgi:ankyrin repeat protein
MSRKHEKRKERSEAINEVIQRRYEFGETILHLAATSCDAEAVAVLIAARADVNVRNSYGLTPLHKAAIRGDGTVCRLLMAAKADIHAKDDHGRTPHDLAKDPAVLAMLVAEAFRQRQAVAHPPTRRSSAM